MNSNDAAAKRKKLQEEERKKRQQELQKKRKEEANLRRKQRLEADKKRKELQKADRARRQKLAKDAAEKRKAAFEAKKKAKLETNKKAGKRTGFGALFLGKNLPKTQAEKIAEIKQQAVAGGTVMNRYFKSTQRKDLKEVREKYHKEKEERKKLLASQEKSMERERAELIQQRLRDQMIPRD